MLPIFKKLRGNYLFNGICLLGLVLVSVHFLNKAPDDESFIQQFLANRQIFEELRQSIQDDFQQKKITYVGSSRVETEQDPPFAKNGLGPLSKDEYDQYLRKMKVVDALSVSHASNESQPEVCVHLWKNGIAPNTEHVSICWLKFPPKVNNRVEADNSKFRGEKAKYSYRQIEGNWYLERNEY